MSRIWLPLGSIVLSYVELLFFKHSEKFSTTFSVIYDFASFWHPTWGAYAVYPKSTGVHHISHQMAKNLYQCLPTLADSACIPISRLPWHPVKIDALQIRQGARPHDDAFLWAQLPLLCQSWCLMEHLQETAAFLPNMRGFLWLSCQIFLPMTQPHPSCKIVSCFLLNHG